MDRSFVAQLNDYRITTAEILYWMPDHKHVLQSFVWQNLDLAPRFPALTKFLDFWERNLDGKRAPGAGGQRRADQAGRVQVRLGPIRPALSATDARGVLALPSARPARQPTARPTRPTRSGRRSRCPSSAWHPACSRSAALMSLAISMAPRTGRSSGSRPAAAIEGRSMLVSSPVKARVSSTSSSRLFTSICLVGVLGQALARGDELGAHVGEIAAQRLRRQRSPGRRPCRPPSPRCRPRISARRARRRRD